MLCDFPNGVQTSIPKNGGGGAGKDPDIWSHLLDPGMNRSFLSHDVPSGSEITPCIKIDKTQVVYRFSGNLTK